MRTWVDIVCLNKWIGKKDTGWNLLSVLRWLRLYLKNSGFWKLVVLCERPDCVIYEIFEMMHIRLWVGTNRYNFHGLWMITIGPQWIWMLFNYFEQICRILLNLTIKLFIAGGNKSHKYKYTYHLDNKYIVLIKNSTFFCSLVLHLFDQKYSNIGKYY